MKHNKINNKHIGFIQKDTSCKKPATDKPTPPVKEERKTKSQTDETQNTSHKPTQQSISKHPTGKHQCTINHTIHTANTQTNNTHVANIQTNQHSHTKQPATTHRRHINQTPHTHHGTLGGHQSYTKKHAKHSNTQTPN